MGIIYVLLTVSYIDTRLTYKKGLLVSLKELLETELIVSKLTGYSVTNNTAPAGHCLTFKTPTFMFRACF